MICCIGNELVADDAAGFEVYRRLGHLPVRVEYLGVGGIDLLPMLSGESHLIVVDAVQFGSPPGTVHLLCFDELPATSVEISAHGLGLRETIEIGKILYPEQVPERVTLVGIEGRCFNRTRDFMTPEVSRAIEVAVAKIESLVQGGE